MDVLALGKHLWTAGQADLGSFPVLSLTLCDLGQVAQPL